MVAPIARVNMTAQRWDDVPLSDERRDWREISFRIILKFAVERRVDRLCAHRAEHQGVAVRCRLRDDARPNAAAGPAFVFDDDRYLILRLEMLRKQASHQVG